MRRARTQTQERQQSKVANSLIFFQYNAEPHCVILRMAVLDTMPSDAIRILVTGGTFDKEYNELTGELFFQRTHVADMLRLGRCELEIEVETPMMIDSLQMSDEGRALILARCQAAPERRIVITHGTDTMERTAATLGSNLAAKTVVLTGAMIPYTFGSSDGIFNLGTALAFAQTLPAGVYIAMNGRHFRWNAVRKNRERGIFEEI